MQSDRKSRQSGWQLAAKVTVDKLAAILLLVVLSPLLLLIAVLVWATLGRPVFYQQVRPGRHAKLFRILKFRTMQPGLDSGTELATDAQRLTRFGRLLRSTSLDELPELWNVVRGELSLVGPRPLLVQYLDRYTPEQARRHDVLPGITGWTQIRGRNNLSWERKFELDIWYVDHWSFCLDLRILMQTLVTVATRKGISLAGHATTTEFMGLNHGGDQ
jgi:lipopolysaccharide/colanic/teichoic acid biosynthesis glycosyltransferase